MTLQWSQVRAEGAGPGPGASGWNAEKRMYWRDIYLVKFIEHGDWTGEVRERRYMMTPVSGSRTLLISQIFYKYILSLLNSLLMAACLGRGPLTDLTMSPERLFHSCPQHREARIWQTLLIRCPTSILVERMGAGSGSLLTPFFPSLLFSPMSQNYAGKNQGSDYI